MARRSGNSGSTRPVEPTDSKGYIVHRDDGAMVYENSKSLNGFFLGCGQVVINDKISRGSIDGLESLVLSRTKEAKKQRTCGLWRSSRLNFQLSNNTYYLGHKQSNYRL
jgi:hypothetical protein